MACMKYYKLSGFSLFEVLLAWFIFITSMLLLTHVQLRSLQRMHQAIAQTQAVLEGGIKSQ